jgi:uncharacterized protein YcnI
MPRPRARRLFVEYLYEIFLCLYRSRLRLLPGQFQLCPRRAARQRRSRSATFRVGHGCGDEATTAMRISIPAGFNGAQPMPKAGWTVSTKIGPLAAPYESHGKKYTEGVLEISWTAKSPENALPAAYYDEFVLRGTTPAKAGPLWFKVLQSCAKGANDWAEVPASGTSTKGLKSPAALLEVLDVQAAGAHAH